MDDDLDPFAPGAMSFTPAHKLTGETFFMRMPDQSNLQDYLRVRDMVRAIEGAGGHVVSMPMAHDNGRSVYTRDLGITLTIGGKNYFFHPKPTSEKPKMQSELHEIFHNGPMAEAFNRGALIPVEIDGDMEGGNLVYNPKRRELYVGVNNYYTSADRTKDIAEEILAAEKDMPVKPDRPLLRALSETERDAYLECASGMVDLDTTASRLQCIADRKPHIQAIKGLQEALDKLTKAAGEPPIKVKPLFMQNAVSQFKGGKNAVSYYHLDGALGVLPSGQMLVYEEAFHPNSLKSLMRGPDGRTLPKNQLYALDAYAANHGAANFITVGNTVITTYANEGIRKFLGEQGYQVTSSTDVTNGSFKGEHDWLLGMLAGIRCATQKITPDMGFPEPAIAKGRSAAGG